jgi:hypothetical protein
MRSIKALAALAALTVTAAALAGPDVEEGSRDAGATVATGKPCKGTGPCNSLSGNLAAGFVSGDIIDMFLIYVPNPSTFYAMTDSTSQFNTMLWLFRVTTDTSGVYTGALAIAANDDMNSTTTTSKVYFPNAGTGQWPAGVYAVAVTASGIKPYGLVPNTLGGGFLPTPLFNTGLPTDLLLPSVAGGQYPVKLWDGASGGGTGSYRIALSGATLIPPGSGIGICGDVFAGDCFVAHSTTKGCTDSTCCQIVCTLDPYCCTAAWDAMCATIAGQNCAQCTVPVNTCPADLNGDGHVDGADLAALLASWGVCR